MQFVSLIVKFSDYVDRGTERRCCEPVTDLPWSYRGIPGESENGWRPGLENASGIPGQENGRRGQFREFN